MSSLSFVLPRIDSQDLVFNEAETREILGFFWPQYANALQTLTITDSVREFAQGLLIVAVDASYAMGYIEILVNVLIKRKPGSSIRSMVAKLVRKNVKHWWKHASSQDLADATVYETVRSAIALKQRHQIDMFLNGLASITKREPTVLSFNKSPCTVKWA